MKKSKKISKLTKIYGNIMVNKVSFDKLFHKLIRTILLENSCALIGLKVLNVIRIGVVNDEL